MPYIKNKWNRKRLDTIMENMHTFFIFQGLRGNFNYLLFKLAKRYCTSYADFADFRSELIEAHDEIGRRLLAPYEDKKIKENGDVE